MGVKNMNTNDDTNIGEITLGQILMRKTGGRYDWAYL